MVEFGRTCGIFILCTLYIVQGKSQDDGLSDTEADELISAIFQNVEISSHTIDNDQNTTLKMVNYCTNPNGFEGVCIPIKNCPKLMKQLTNPSAKTFLQKSKCGPKKDNLTNPKVCCGEQSNFLKESSPWPSSCGYQNVTMRGRILGGQQAVLGEFPWLARLYHKDKRNVKTFGCSGFLITSKFILTAAHCLSSENVQYLGPVFEVRLGEHNTRTKIDCDSKNTTCAPEVKKILIKNIFVHPSYDNTSKHHHHDIGLIELKKEANFSSYVSPICIMDKLDFEPFEYWLSGWGKTGEAAGLSHIKMKVSVPPFSRQNCTKKYEPLRVKIIEKQLCAGGKENKDSCTGDSGGPLMLVKDSNHWFAAGVVSFGYGCGRDGWPGIYTNITSYSNWIKKTVQGTTKLKSRSKGKHSQKN